MATSVNFIEFVCEQIHCDYEIRYKKMFGEYMVYANDKPIFLVCDNTVYVKILDVLCDKMCSAEKGYPYQGAKEYYILDIENSELVAEIAMILEAVTPVPKPRKRKSK